MLIFNFWFSGFFPSKRGVRGVTPSCLLRGVTPTDATQYMHAYIAHWEEKRHKSKFVGFQLFRRGNFRFDVAHVCIVSLWLLRPLWSVLKIQLWSFCWNTRNEMAIIPVAIDKSILSNFELWRCSSQWAIAA